MCILSVLRSPDPFSVVIIKEIENGIDPVMLHILMNEIQHFIENKKGQVILTTHSPYFLDLVPLKSIVVVEKDINNNQIFKYPYKDKLIQQWYKEFSPGRLYTMGIYK